MPDNVSDELELAHDDDRLLGTLERLLAIDAVALDDALDQATQLVAQALRADKVDVFLLDAAVETLVARGTSDTPMGRRQKAIGLDRLALANGGRIVQVFRTGEPYLTGHEEDDLEDLRGVREGLGIRSTAAVPLSIVGDGSGVLFASSAAPKFFTPRDMRFIQAVAHWIGMVARRAELVEQVTRQAHEQGRRVAAEELVTVVAHDLRNYLTPLRARLDLILRRAQRRNQQRDYEDAAVAARELDRLSRLIANLLDVGRLEQGIFSLSLQPMDLVAQVRDIAEGLRTPRNAVEFNSPEELIVVADPDRLRQAIENVLANALRHSPDGAPVVVDISANVRASDGTPRTWAIITISDRGPGVAPEMLPRLFTPFVHGAGSSGMGLGLYLASRIASEHGGTLTVESPPDGGARFRFAFPA